MIQSLATELGKGHGRPGGSWRRDEGSAAEMELAAGDGQMDAQRTG